MKVVPSINSLAFIFGIPLVLLASLFFLVGNSDFLGSPYSSLAVSIDLLFTIPFVYFLLIRRTKISKATVLPVMFLGFFSGFYLLSAEDQVYLNYFKQWVLPILELAVFVLIAIKIFNFRKTYKNSKGSDFYSILTEVCSESFPRRISILVTTEIAVFYYGFLFWKGREFNTNEFTYHKNSASLSLMGAILLIIGVESVVLHLLVSKWNETLAWVLTVLSIYTLIQLFGFLKSILDRPHKIEGGKLYLRYGIMHEAIIDRDEILSVELSSKEVGSDENFRRLSFLGSLEGHNVVIRIKNEKSLIGLYGTKKKYKTLLFFVDNKVEFKNRLEVHGS